MAEEADIAAEEPPRSEDDLTPRRRRPRRAIAVGVTTLACALGGALAGAAAFSAQPGAAARPSAAGDRLTTSSSHMPSVLGSICGSTQQTATAADTAIACEDYGTASYRAVAARAMQSAVALHQGSPASLATPEKSLAAPPASKAQKSVEAVGKRLRTPKPPAAKSLVPVKHSSKTNKTCVSTPTLPPAVSLPSIPTTTLHVALGNSGSVSVSTKPKGASVCAGTGTKHKKKHKTSKNQPTTTTTTTTNPVQSVVNGLSGGLSGIGSGLGG